MFRFCLGAMGAMFIFLIALPTANEGKIDSTVTASTDAGSGVVTEGSWLVTRQALQRQARMVPLALPDNLGF